MLEVLVVQHVAEEGPGAIGAALERAGHTLRTVRIDRGEAVPHELGSARGLVVMGGPMGVGDLGRLPHLRDELRLIEHALASETPVLGVCLGSQLLAHVLGARVYAGPQKEIGWYEVTLQPAASEDALLGGLPSRLRALHWHGDVFELPRGAVSLARSELTREQAFRYGARAYGILFHLEVSAAQVRHMVQAFADELAEAGTDPAAMLADAEVHLAATARHAANVFDRFAALCAATASA